MNFYNGEFYQRLLANLKVMSMLKPGDKLSVNESVLQIEMRRAYIPECLRRFLYSQNRYRTVSAISEIVQHCENVVMLLKGNPELDKEEVHTKLKHIYRETKGAESGIKHLLFTYADDSASTSQMSVIGDRLTQTLGRIEEILGVMNIFEAEPKNLKTPLGTGARGCSQICLDDV